MSAGAHAVAARKPDLRSLGQVAGATAWIASFGWATLAEGGETAFTEVQPAVFAAPGALSNAFADVDCDGDPDLAVSFTNGAIRLYLNHGGTFVEADASHGFPQAGPEVRGLSWGDYDADGDPDLYAGVSREAGKPARNFVFRNDGHGRFAEIAQDVGLVLIDADSRQASWVDYDGDGDLDLFSAQRASRNRLFRNDAGRFADVSEQAGLDDPRRTVGACWFDMDEDGDLDLFLANQQADKDAFYRNDGGKFADVAPQLGMHQPERTLAEGGVGCTVGDYDNDGHLDLFVATYGDTLLYRNLGGGRFRESAAETGLRLHGHFVGASWGDADNDGWLDLFVTGYDDERSRAQLFMNRGGRFEASLAADSPLAAADHGVQWADVDGDGDLDLSLTETFPDTARHRLFRNDLPMPAAGRSLQVRVLDRTGRATRAGAEIRIFDQAGKLLGSALVATGDGYGSQGAGPIHVGLPGVERVDVEASFPTAAGRERVRLEEVQAQGRGDPPLVVKPRE